MVKPLFWAPWLFVAAAPVWPFGPGSKWSNCSCFFCSRFKSFLDFACLLPRGSWDRYAKIRPHQIEAPYVLRGAMLHRFRYPDVPHRNMLVAPMCIFLLLRNRLSTGQNNVTARTLVAKSVLIPLVASSEQWVIGLQNPETMVKQLPYRKL